MFETRKDAIAAVAARPALKSGDAVPFDLETYASDVFGIDCMRERLPKGVFQKLYKTITEKSPLDPTIADDVANAMKRWAIEKGATHFTHWFQPLTGSTAEKHDSFVEPDSDGKAITVFSGKNLIISEPDASSFPSGGLRATFEARGYTAWDCTSPAFLKEDSSGLTLCIPTAFCSYNGEALDKKTPLLRSVEALSKQVIRILKLFGDDATEQVNVSCGAEQEYFLVDKKMWKERPDFVFTGRSLLGAKPPKTQEMDDHYFGTLKERVSAYMKELDLALWKVGVPAKTKHNEAAPAQHELAPIFETVNIACDHNQIAMEMMKKIADHHDMVCLFHEKPFAGINGSGKHNNWSITTPAGVNLFNPGKTPGENAQFLVFLCAVISAIDDHAALIRASAANAGNDHRLGALEAPPAIISIFLGDELTSILEHIESGEERNEQFGGKLDTGVSSLPNLPLDTTDRNRTSPFAFTGNKFEFRMVPSSASIAGPNTVLNTVVADALCTIADRLENAKDFNKELHELLSEIIKKHKRVIFNGNGYGDEWVAEAKRRGLPNINNSVDSYAAFLYPESIKLFEKHHVYSETELRSRYEIKMEKYAKIVGIEAQTLLQMVKRQIMPSCLRFADETAKSINSVKATGLQCDMLPAEELLRKLTNSITALHKATKKLEKAVIKSENISDDYIAHAKFARDHLVSDMDEIRKHADYLETIVSNEFWPIPTYNDLIYSV